jgi:uncharacterized protein YprB with RNaseH-like and TPR domain
MEEKMANDGAIERIAVLKEKGLSFQEIATQLDISKDQAQKLHKRYAATHPEAPKDVQVVKSVPKGDYAGFRMAFYDLETTYSSWTTIFCMSVADEHGNVKTLSLETHKGKTWMDDSKLVKAIADELAQYDILVGWNSKMFDLPIINARLLETGQRPIGTQMHIDLMWYATGRHMRAGRRSLENISKYFRTNNSKTPLDVRLWQEAERRHTKEGKQAFRTIVEHCEADVLVLRDVFAKMKPLLSSIHR